MRAAAVLIFLPSPRGFGVSGELGNEIAGVFAEEDMSRDNCDMRVRSRDRARPEPECRHTADTRFEAIGARSGTNASTTRPPQYQ
jgi:hypothetical protein